MYTSGWISNSRNSCILAIYHLDSITNLNCVSRVCSLTRCVQLESCIYYIFQIFRIHNGIFANGIWCCCTIIVFLAHFIDVFNESIVTSSIFHFATDTGFHIIENDRACTIRIYEVILYVYWADILYRCTRIRFTICSNIGLVIPATSTFTIGYECFICNIRWVVVLAIVTANHLCFSIRSYHVHNRIHMYIVNILTFITYRFSYDSFACTSYLCRCSIFGFFQVAYINGIVPNRACVRHFFWIIQVGNRNSRIAIF